MFLLTCFLKELTTLRVISAKKETFRQLGSPWDAISSPSKCTRHRNGRSYAGSPLGDSEKGGVPVNSKGLPLPPAWLGGRWGEDYTSNPKQGQDLQGTGGVGPTSFGRKQCYKEPCSIVLMVCGKGTSQLVGARCSPRNLRFRSRCPTPKLPNS